MSNLLNLLTNISSTKKTQKTIFMKKLILLFLTLVAINASANDGVYFVSGSQLVPANETDIAIKKEVLTISLCDDGFARVDVQYEFYNNGPAKTVEMGFEANPAYNDGVDFDKSGAHPHIKDFTVVMNGEKINYRNAIIRGSKEGWNTDFKPLDVNRMKTEIGDYDAYYLGDLYDPVTKDTINFAYSYTFTANFKEGLNTIHHTYRYRSSYAVGHTFDVPYWLTPAMRWANHQIDDFTLKIQANNTIKHFIIPSEPFGEGVFRLTRGVGKIRTVKVNDYESEESKTKDVFEIVIRDGEVECHVENFKPAENFEIQSADVLCFMQADENNKKNCGSYDRSDTFWPAYGYSDLGSQAKRIYRNMPYASRGYMFKDKNLQAYFDKLFWYIPDPNWKMDTKDFTKREWELVNGKGLGMDD